jgi:ABC-type Fe3+-hydroxamate transport system substrate-binding protein
MLFTDQMNRTINIPAPPQRIISLVPSQTELLFDLGLGDRVLGITKFCIHPEEWFRTKTRVGGTKTVHLGKLASLQPDLIIANKEENVQAQVEEVAKDFPVWISDINNLEDALQMIVAIGHLTGTEDKARNIATAIKNGFVALTTGTSPMRTAYLIWKDPYMTVGSDTFIHHVLQHAGFTNVFAHQQRYPQVSIETLQQVAPQVLLLSSEPFPFKEKHLEELRALLPHTHVLLVDGELFSWYGSRLLKTPAYLQNLRDRISVMA